MGIDASKKSLAVTMLTDEGEIVKQATVAPTRSALKSFLARFPGCEVASVYEAGCLGYWLHDTLSELGVRSIVTPPSKVPRAPGDRVKTNRRDSQTLAVQLMGRQLPAVYVPSKLERAERQLTRAHAMLQGTRKRTMNEIKSFLMFHHIERPPEAGKSWSGAFLRWLETHSFAGVPGGEHLRRSLDALLRMYREVDAEVKELKKAIRKLANDRSHRRAVQVLKSNSGVGEHTAMIVLAEICGHRRMKHRFPTSQQFVSFLGITPGEHSTGETRHIGHITKAGNRFIRGALVQCAWSWIRRDAAAKTTYGRIARRRGKKRAIVAMTRRLATRIYWQLRQLSTTRPLA